MTPADLIAELPPESCGVATRVLLRYVADHVHYAILTGGLPVRDATDFALWLRELADHARVAELKIARDLFSVISPAEAGRRGAVETILLAGPRRRRQLVDGHRAGGGAGADGEGERVKRLRTVRTRLRQKDFAELTDTLASLHYQRCPSGYMVCSCRFALQLRELVKLAERKRIQ